MSALKPCPFCASPAKVTRIGPEAIAECTSEECPQFKRVFDADAAAAVWNVRPIESALYAAAERALNFIANTESEFGETLESGDALRGALALARGAA